MTKTTDPDVARVIRAAGADPSEVAWAAGLAGVCLIGVGVLIGGTW